MRFKYIGAIKESFDELYNMFEAGGGSVDEFWDALSKKEGKKEKLNEIRACGNEYEG